ncbi:MAG TPA: acyltransferase family protein [Rhodanobacteraceae bacterium]|nr:acyltransferase family protein [Rhodanobacteraceae bacterium]
MGSATGNFRLGYRADIEGLRAIAILLVVAAHAKVTWLRGGFVGVDVFYILSGYLITGLLVQEAATTGRMRFANFYARRLRRLLPALLLMLVVVCIVAKLVLPPTQLPRQASNAASTALWLSNFQFAFWNMDYFAPSSDTALFLHTWSLGVEEQFYLVWPLLVVLVLGAWKGVKPVARLARLKWLFGGIFLASFALSLYWTSRSPLFGFYLMPSRAWQFALGALVFLAFGSPAFKATTVFANSKWLRPAGWLGLGMIVLAALLIPPTAPYPGTWALLPSFGAALVLAAGTQQGSWVARALSLRPAQAIGRVSYSWYLWHWPVLLLGATLVDIDSGWNRLLLVVLSLLIAAVSYHFFETPIRHNRKLVAKPRLAVASALVVMAITVLLLRGWQIQAEEYSHSPELALFTAARHDEAEVYAKGCFGSYQSTKVKICSFGNPHATHTIVLMGDSKAAQWAPAYRDVFTQRGWRLLVVTKSACPMVDAPYVALPLRREYTECTRWRRNAIREVTSLRPDIVVLSESYVTYPFTKENWTKGTRDVLTALSGSVPHIYLMRPTPELPVNGPLCLEPRGWIYNALASRSRCQGLARAARFEDIGRWLEAAASPFPNTRFIDMTQSVCPSGVCHAELNSTIVFSDSGHMTATFAHTLAPALTRALRENPRPHPSATAKAGG